MVGRGGVTCRTTTCMSYLHNGPMFGGAVFTGRYTSDRPRPLSSHPSTTSQQHHHHFRTISSLPLRRLLSLFVKHTFSHNKIPYNFAATDISLSPKKKCRPRSEASSKMDGTPRKAEARAVQAAPEAQGVKSAARWYEKGFPTLP